MSILRWIEAGATGSFGTVVEPCNYTTKFPQASVALSHYFHGETLIEAYWKSVAWPGEGLFVGEPLARPYGTTYAVSDGMMTIKTTALVPGTSYQIESAPSDTFIRDRVQPAPQHADAGYLNSASALAIGASGRSPARGIGAGVTLQEGIGSALMSARARRFAKVGRAARAIRGGAAGAPAGRACS